MSSPSLPASSPPEPTAITVGSASTPQLTIDSIVPAPQVNSEVSVLSLELEFKQAELEKAQLQNQELLDNILRRGNWGNRIFWLLLGWLIAVVAIVTAQGFGFAGFHLDNSIMLAFIGTTTLDVLSLGYIVANYLFQKRQ